MQPEQLRRIAFWSHDLNENEFEQARKGIVEKDYSKGSHICHRGDRFDYWTGVSSGIVRFGTTSLSGKIVTFTGLRTGSWFGEGTMLKNVPRQYDLITLRDSRIALMNRSTFLWLFENSVAFNRFLVRQLNERLGQFIALVEYDRSLDADARVARSIAWLFNPVLYPLEGMNLDISQEEIGLLSGVSRPVTNKSLKTLEAKGLISVERNSLTVLDLERLRNFGG